MTPGRLAAYGISMSAKSPMRVSKFHSSGNVVSPDLLIRQLTVDPQGGFLIYTCPIFRGTTEIPCRTRSASLGDRMQKKWNLNDGSKLREPAAPPLPELTAPNDIPPETSAESHVGPVINNDVAITRSRFWKIKHASQLDCGSSCAAQTSFTAGFSRKRALELESKIGAKLDYLLPGLSAGVSGKRTITVSDSTEETTTHTCSVKAPECTCINHAEYQLIERYTFEYRGGFFGNTPLVDSIEDPHNIFRFSKILYPQTGCCPAQDDQRAQLRLQGQIVPIVARDGSLAAILLAQPHENGTFQIDGSDQLFRLGDPVRSEVIVRSLGLTGELSEEWSVASPRWEAYGGSISALYPKQARRSKGFGSDRTMLMLGVVAGGTLTAAFSLLKRNRLDLPTERTSWKDRVLKDQATKSGGLSREEIKVTFQENAVSPHSPVEAKTYTAFESE